MHEGKLILKIRRRHSNIGFMRFSASSTTIHHLISLSRPNSFKLSSKPKRKKMIFEKKGLPVGILINSRALLYIVSLKPLITSINKY